MLGDSLLAAVWLYSADVSRAAQFYSEKLGLRPLQEPGHVAHFDAGSVRLSLHPWPNGPQEPTGSFLVFVVDDIDANTGELRRRGVDVKGDVQDAPFGRILEFRDPDGHELYLFELPQEGTAEYDNVRPLVEHYRLLRARLE